MVDKKQRFFTIGQIDATGVRGPHEKELEDISNDKYPLFVDLDEAKLKEIVEGDLGGKIETIGFSEDWTISMEMFPEVNIHLAYSYFGEEDFGDEIEAEFKCYFSGERVHWVPGEDSVTYVDIIMNFIANMIKGEEPFEKDYQNKTELMVKVLTQRTEPFNLLIEEDRDALSSFLGAKVWKTTQGWRIKKEAFPDIYIELTWTKDGGLDIGYSGENLEKIGSYHLELVGIFLINHLLRYITINNQDKDLPDICYIMFSRMFTKEKGWEHRTR